MKTAKLAKYTVANALIVMAMCQSAMNCDEARAVVTAHQMSDPEGSAFNLFKLLEARFTQKAIQILQKLLVDLNSLSCSIGETTCQVLDRFNKLVLGINAIDAAQLPSNLVAHFAAIGTREKRKKERAVREVDHAFAAVQGSSHSGLTCFNCGGLGHFKREYRMQLFSDF